MEPAARSSIALLLALGLRFAPALFVAGFAAEALVRGLPAGARVVAGSSAVIAAGYTAAAWALRGPARIDPLLRGMRDVARLVGVTAVATLAVGAGYVAIYFADGRIPSTRLPGRRCSSGR